VAAASEGRNARRRREALERQQSKEAAERTEHRQRVRAAVLLVAGLLLLVGLGIAYLVVQDRRVDALERRLAVPGCTTDTRADGTKGGGHVTDPTYAVEPPAGGDHLEDWSKAGTYSAADAPADGLLVHSLEHGYVILWHRSDVPAEVVSRLRQVAQRHRDDVLVVERPGSPVPVAATAWGQRLLCQDAQVDAIEAFLDLYVGEGPEDVPRG
jgi:hypothetical protein